MGRLSAVSLVALLAVVSVFDNRRLGVRINFVPIKTRCFLYSSCCAERESIIHLCTLLYFVKHLGCPQRTKTTEDVFSVGVCCAAASSKSI